MNNENLEKIRHSLAHILAAVVQKQHPEAQFGVGPVVENGFYYDMLLEEPLKASDLNKIRKEMQKMISQKLEFIKEEWPIDKAIEYFKENNQIFKVELLNDLKIKGTTAIKDAGDESLFNNVENITTVTVYKTGDFIDLCRGPHVNNTLDIDKDCFELTKLAGAYWRGNENNPQLQRVYGIAFKNKDEVNNYLEMLVEAEKRDHRKLGKELDLFVFSDLIGAGLPLFTPRGTILRNQIDAFVQEMRDEYGFEEVTIPHITKKDAYIKSGHWQKFEDELFKTVSRDGHEFALKPMNCPHHAQIYSAKQRSYRELPVRYRETTMVYRDEQSGELSGLSRVRSITQDDAHIFCRNNQIEDEISKVIDIVNKYYKAFGIKLWVRLSLHNPESMSGYLGDERMWRVAEDQLIKVVQNQNIEYKKAIGEAAFYGPKIDFMGTDALGREFQASTIQLDFGQPEGFDLTCIDENGEKERIVMIHCAIAGSLERALVLLIEHFAGAFPVWMAPEQVRVIPVSEKYLDYGNEIVAKLKAQDVRISIDDSNESLGKRIRSSELMKVPYTLIVGEKEQSSHEVSVRKYGKGDLGSEGIVEFSTTLLESIKNRSL